jgi:signal transduction histidine kinase
MNTILQSRLFLRFWDRAGAASIRIKVLGIVLGVIVLLGLFVTIQMRAVLTSTLRHELHHQGEELSREYVNNIAAMIANDNQQSLQIYLEGWRNHYSSGGHNTIVEYINVHDGAGNVLASAPQPGTVAAQEHGDLVQITTYLPDADVFIELALAETNIQQTVSAVTLRLVAITAVMIAIGFGAAFFLTWILTRPIYDLVRATEAVTHGDFSQRLPRWANDEIGQLTVAFNTMTDSLEKAKQERAEQDRLRAQYVSNVIVAQEDERQRISRELHDSIGQLLTTLLVGLKNLKEACAPTELEHRIEELRAVVGKTLEEVRTIAWQLRPSALDDLGLISALQRYIDDYQERHQISIDFIASSFNTRLPVEMEASIYRIVQESLTNIARHSQATAASVVIDRRGNAIRLIIEDNGIGFDPTVVRNSLGLQGIRERAALFNGRLTIEAQPGQGTSLFIEIPTTQPFGADTGIS